MKKILLSIMALFLTVSIAWAQPKPDKIGNITVQPVEHASLALQIPGKLIFVDPVGHAAEYNQLGNPDIVLITDIHGDHFSPKTLEQLQLDNAVLVVPQVVADKLTGALKSKVHVMHNGQQESIAGISISALPMYNMPESPKAFHTKGRGNGYVVTLDGKRVYISGDTGATPEMKALKNIDVAFVCMNLPYTMDIQEAAEGVLAFKPKIVYPYHYRGQNGMSDIKAFKTLVEQKDHNIDVRLRNWYPDK
jgi:L-ascorbate metabolism protein UlaG (beta-lactamase superfamily)